MANLTGVRKAAVLLMSLPSHDASAILRGLTRTEVEGITLEIANLKRIDRQDQQDVISEFYQMAQAEQEMAEGGLEAARHLLEQAFDSQRASEILHHLTSFLQRRPFEVLRKADASQVLAFVQSEHPQTIAVLLAYMDPLQASRVLSGLPGELQNEVAQRIARMGRIAPELVKEVEALVERRLSTVAIDEVVGVGGVNSIVPILNNADRTSERAILDSLEQVDPELADEIRSRMFVFENIVQLDDRAIQKVLRRVDNKTLAMALKGTATEVATKIFKNLSQKAAELLQDDIDVLGPVRIRDVEQAQREIITAIRVLEDQGEVVLSRGEEDDYVV
jgi:flagellar motor switch protein FliG